MSLRNKAYPALSLAIGAFSVGSLMPSAGITAENPFKATQLSAGYRVAAEDTAKNKEGKCGEGRCGTKSEKEAVCGLYTVGSAHKDDTKVKDGKCGGHKVVEALCGGDR